MSFTVDLAKGLAEYLADNGVGTWREVGAYTEDETALTLQLLPSTPDRAIALTVYDVDDPATVPLSTVAVQVRSRGTTDPQVVADIDDAVFEVLHGATHLRLRGIDVHQVLRRSSTALGPDDNRRLERTSNYYLDLNRPTLHRPAS